ncbi:uncharacterized protein [Onthophagus taurus]|uniref:uncharacterized protein n=1 Tax=Onthophagus taurus TaxID=166361 RepID=UPI0039BE3A35
MALSSIGNKISTALKQEDFTVVLKSIHELKTTNQAIQVLYLIYKSREEPESINNITPNEITTLISATFTFIKQPTDNEIKHYLSCTYRLLQYLIKEDAYNNIFELKDVWCPPFITKNTSKEHLETFLAQFLLLLIYSSKLIALNDERVEKLISLIIDTISRFSLELLIEKKILNYLYQILWKLINTKAFETLSKYLLTRCIENNNVNKLLEVIYYMLSSQRKGFDSYQPFLNIENELNSFGLFKLILTNIKMMITNGIFTECVNLIYGLKENESINQYAKILEVFFLQHINLKPDKGVESHLNTLKHHTEIVGLCDCLESKCKIIKLELNRLMIINSFYNYILNNDDIPKSCLKTILNVYIKTFSLYNEKNLNEINVNLFTSTLSIIFNTATKLDKKNVYKEFAIQFFEIVVKCYLILENLIPHNEQYEGSFLHTSLTLISNNFMALGQIEKAMAAIAYNVFHCKKDFKTCICTSKWIQIKTSHKENLTIKKITIASLLTNKSKLQTFKTSFNEEEISYILLKEIKIYSTFYKSKIPLTYCCLELNEFGNSFLTGEALVMAWFNSPEIILPENYPIITDLLSKFEKNTIDFNDKSRIEIAKVYYLLYHVNIKCLGNEIKEQILMQPPEKEDKSYRYGMDIPNNKWDCAIIHQLSMEEISRVKTPLIKCREILEGIFLSDSFENKDHLAKIIEEFKLFEFIMELAFSFLLHTDSIEAIKTFLLLEKIADKTQRFDYKIKAIGRIINSIDIDCVLQLFKEGETLINKVSYDEACEFYTYVSTSYYNKGDIKKSHEYYLKAKNYFKQTSSFGDKFINIELEFLEWKLMSLPDKGDIFTNNMELIQRSSTIFTKINSVFCEQTNNVNRIKLLEIRYTFEIKLLHSYNMKWPREGRGAAKLLIDRCQTYILPFYYAEITLYLAKMDLQCEKLSDCQAKIDGLSTLLEISSGNEDLEKLIKNFDGISLDNNITFNNNYSKFTKNGSPTLKVTKKEYPRFTSHQNDCECFYCTSIDYQKLVLNYFILKGTFWAAHNEKNTAEYFYKTALVIYNTLISKTNYILKLKKIFNYNILLDLKETFLECYISILHHQAKLSVGTKKFNAELITLIPKIKYKNSLLYQETHQLQLNNLLLCYQKINSTTPSSPKVSSPTNDNNALVKTPENNVSQVKFVASQRVSPLTKKRVVKSIPFDSSDDEIGESSSSTTTISNKRTTKTPAIKVYQGNSKAKSEKKTAKAPKILVTVPSEEKVNIESNHSNIWKLKENDESCIDENKNPQGNDSKNIKGKNVKDNIKGNKGSGVVKKTNKTSISDNKNNQEGDSSEEIQRRTLRSAVRTKRNPK